MKKRVHYAMCLFTAFLSVANAYMQLGNFKKQQSGKLILSTQNQQAQLLHFKAISGISNPCYVSIINKLSINRSLNAIQEKASFVRNTKILYC